MPHSSYLSHAPGARHDITADQNSLGTLPAPSGNRVTVSPELLIFRLSTVILRFDHCEYHPTPFEVIAPMKLTERELAIVTMLAAGHTDASTAHQLGISSRTIAYTMRGLMDRCGVQNRFQLGLILGANTEAPEPDEAQSE